jgi:DNA-binding LytR/AlgR family response regulator
MTRQSNPAARLRFTRVENERFAASGSAGPAVHSWSRPGAILILRIRGRVILLEEAGIDWIEGAANYVRLHAGQERHRVRGTLKDLEGGFGPPALRAHTPRRAGAVRPLRLTPDPGTRAAAASPPATPAR